MTRHPELTPDDLLVLAARGSAEAQAELVNRCFAAVADGTTSFEHAARTAEIFARMAASHGGRADKLRLAAVLMYSAQAAENEGDPAEMVELAAEGVEVLGRMADAGDEEACLHVNMAAELLPARIISRAAERAALAQPSPDTTH